jgi:hypothetical protein
MRHLTVRNVPPELSEALDREKHRRGTSLNQTVIDLLCQGLGCAGPRERRNGLRRLAGTWSPEEFRGFEEAVAVTEQVDEELCR